MKQNAVKIGMTLVCVIFGATLLAGCSGKPFGLGSAKSSSTARANASLWRASVTTVRFMPIRTSDRQKGLIVTNWYRDPQIPNYRYRMSIFIADRQLRRESLRIAVFKQVRDSPAGNWRDAAVDKAVVNR